MRVDKWSRQLLLPPDQQDDLFAIGRFEGYTIVRLEVKNVVTVTIFGDVDGETVGWVWTGEAEAGGTRIDDDHFDISNERATKGEPDARQRLASELAIAEEW